MNNAGLWHRERFAVFVLGVMLALGACNSSDGSSSTGAAANDDSSASLRSRGAPSVPRASGSDVSMPELSGPIEGGVRGHPWAAADEKLSPLEDFGYVQEEYFYSGTAQGRDRDGRPDGTAAPYTTRMLVARPENPEDFNGTVLVEWFNVTGEMEMDVVWAQVYGEILREGYAYVGISVQQVGVQTSPLALKYWDPVRYAPLIHPGDAYAYDMFAQGARALFARGDVQPLGDLTAERVIATGESQSAALLIPYINHVDAEHRVFDGYLVHTFPGDIRRDVPVPVLMLLSETEVEGFTSPIGMAAQSPDEFGAIFQRVPGAGVLAVPAPENAPADFPNFRVWEIAGAAHFDRQALVYVSAQASRDLMGSASYDGLPLGCAEVASESFLYPSFLPTDGLGTDRINQLAMQRPARAALHALNEWLVTGAAPKRMPRIARNPDGTIARDEDALARGGIRMPVLEEPIGLNEGQSCIFFGRYEPSDKAAARYDSQCDYLQALDVAAQVAVAQGVLLPPEADAYITEAAEESAGLWDNDASAQDCPALRGRQDAR